MSSVRWKSAMRKADFLEGGLGNPFARNVKVLRQALLDSISPEDIQDVAARLLDLAKDENVQAAKLLFAYTIGEPPSAPEPDRLVAEEWQVYQETTPMKKEPAAVMSAGDPDFHMPTWRHRHQTVKTARWCRQQTARNGRRPSAASRHQTVNFGLPRARPSLSETSAGSAKKSNPSLSASEWPHLPFAGAQARTKCQFGPRRGLVVSCRRSRPWLGRVRVLQHADDDQRDADE